MKALQDKIDVAKASGGGMLALMLLILFLRESNLLFSSLLLIPFVIGHLFMRSLKIGEVLDRAFWFMVFNLPFGIVLLFSGVYYLDVVFPVLYFYILSSPLMFSLGGMLRNRRLFAITLSLFLFLTTALYGYRSHLTIVLTNFLNRNIVVIFNLFMPYNAFLLLYQIWKLRRRM